MMHRGFGWIALLLALAVPSVTAGAEVGNQTEQEASDESALATEVRALYNEGAYGELVETVEAARDEDAKIAPEVLYLLAVSYEELDRENDAVQAYARLAEREQKTDAKRSKRASGNKASRDDAAEEEHDVWARIGRSAELVACGDLDAALEAAREAVEASPKNPFGHYQEGRVLTAQSEHGAAAEAFVAVLEREGDFAYAHYWAGINYYQTRNLVAASNHLARFLQLAPEAPEKVQVQGILATIQG